MVSNVVATLIALTTTIILGSFLLYVAYQLIIVSSIISSGGEDRTFIGKLFIFSILSIIGIFTGVRKLLVVLAHDDHDDDKNVANLKKSTVAS